MLKGTFVVYKAQIWTIKGNHSGSILLELYYDLTKVIDLDETNIRAFLGRALMHEVPKIYE
ncbi:MAG TPA: hypothetical protein VE818_00575, partial [Nitrososphaeraceae archaeon]|nr:hypothetical protein [Nitrososphaeraceae archaeon]